MPTEQPEGNIRDLKDFKDIQRACCKAIPLSLVAHKGPADYLIAHRIDCFPYSASRNNRPPLGSGGGMGWPCPGG